MGKDVLDNVWPEIVRWHVTEVVDENGALR